MFELSILEQIAFSYLMLKMHFWREKNFFFCKQNVFTKICESLLRGKELFVSFDDDMQKILSGTNLINHNLQFRHLIITK